MKLFEEFRSTLSEKSAPKGNTVMKSKIKGYDVVVNKDKEGFTVYIDGDKLDSYKSKKEAEKMAKSFIDEL